MTLGICMIVRDEEETLVRCLDGIKDIADEIVIVDTGSRDSTRDIAARYTDRVYDFVWCDDFSAARNFSFSLATTDYVMWLDADDVVAEPDAEEIRRLCDGGGFDVAYLRYAVADGDKQSFFYYRERIIRRALGLKWEGAVHEVITPVGKMVWSDACIVHKKIKSGQPMRNLHIYQKEISEGKELSPRDKFYYGRELFFNGMLPESIAVLENYLSGEGWVENRVEACRTLFRAHMRRGDRQNAIKSLLRAFAISRPRAEECCHLGEYFFGNGDLDAAAYWYNCALNSGDDLKSGGFVDTAYTGFIPAIWLCVIYDRLGDSERAERFNELAGSFRPDDESYLHNRQYFKENKLKGKNQSNDK